MSDLGGGWALYDDRVVIDGVIMMPRDEQLLVLGDPVEVVVHCLEIKPKGAFVEVVVDRQVFEVHADGGVTVTGKSIEVRRPDDVTFAVGGWYVA